MPDNIRKQIAEMMVLVFQSNLWYLSLLFWKPICLSVRSLSKRNWMLSVACLGKYRSPRHRGCLQCNILIALTLKLSGELLSSPRFSKSASFLYRFKKMCSFEVLMLTVLKVESAATQVICRLCYIDKDINSKLLCPSQRAYLLPLNSANYWRNIYINTQVNK